MNFPKRTYRTALALLTSLAVFFLQGCGFEPISSPADTTQKIIATVTPKSEESTPAPTVAVTAGKFDITALSKLDNTKLSWWIILNDTHSPTGIDAGVRSIIEAHDGYYIGDIAAKKIYLTFDEGYENGYTSQILDDLKNNNVKAIFFITMPYLENNPELVKRMVDEGHEVGNHSVSHPSFPDLDYTQLLDEFKILDDRFFADYKKKMKYFRPPMGEYSEMTLEAASQFGYETIFWSFAYADWDVNNQKGADNAYEVVMKNHHNGAVFLLHAVSSDNAGAMDRIIKGLKAAGYTLSPFDI